MSKLKWQVPLWNAINSYSKSCGGDPSKNVYGNKDRMNAVIAAEAVVECELKVSEEKINRLVNAGKEVLNEIRAYQGEGEFEQGNPVKHLCDVLKEAIAFATGDPKDFAQLACDTPLSPEEDEALQKAAKQLFGGLRSD